MEQEQQLLKVREATVTHEMITPLRCISKFAEDLKGSLQDFASNKVAELIYKTSKLLECQVNELLDKHMLEKNMVTLKLESLNLGTLIKDTIEILSC